MNRNSFHFKSRNFTKATPAFQYAKIYQDIRIPRLNYLSTGDAECETTHKPAENFKPTTEVYWEIKVKHTKNDVSTDFSWNRRRIFDRQACSILYYICLENPFAVVTEVKTKCIYKLRPVPLNTLKLKELASSKLNMSTDETMRVAQQLFERGIISNPHTKTNIFSKDTNLVKMVHRQTKNPKWGYFAQLILSRGGPTPRRGRESEPNHLPIHPVRHTNSLSGNQQRLYELIVRSFLACCSSDAEGQETIVSIQIANEKFSTKFRRITHGNYLDVYPYENISSKENVYKIGERFTPDIYMISNTISVDNKTLHGFKGNLSIW